MSLRTLVEHIRDVYLDQTMVFYAGAGISYDCPSHLPLGGQLARAVISGFYEALDGPKRETFETALDYLTLEELCGLIQKELAKPEQLIRSMAQALDSKTLTPNRNHKLLARALHKGHLIVTTNYDSQIERAYIDIYKESFPPERIAYDDSSFGTFVGQFQGNTLQTLVLQSHL